MLLEFRVGNSRSIRDEQVLSLIAAKDHTLESTHVVDTGLAQVSRVLRTAAIYGPNAGGKSNLLKALSFFQAMVADSATLIREGQALNCPPFRLDPASLSAPSTFELTFLVDNVRHQYGFAVTTERVVEEWLLVYQKSKPQRWFHRHYDREQNRDAYEFSSHLTGPRKVWQQATRPNALFLSTAVNLNSEKLRPVFTWLIQKLAFVSDRHGIHQDWTLKLLENEEGKRVVLGLMAAADIGIVDFELEQQPGQHFTINFEAGKPPSHSIEDREVTTIKTIHRAPDGSRIAFNLLEESLGTQQWLWLVGPILDVIQHGKTLFIDEIDSSLHTLLVRQIIAMFNNPEINPNGAQLIFTTHDTTLMDAGILRRDQVWFVERGSDQASRLFPLLDFSPRKHEALEKGYLMGRYGALPFISEFRP